METPPRARSPSPRRPDGRAPAGMTGHQAAGLVHLAWSAVLSRWRGRTVLIAGSTSTLLPHRGAGTGWSARGTDRESECTKAPAQSDWTARDGTAGDPARRAHNPEGRGQLLPSPPTTPRRLQRGEDCVFDWHTNWARRTAMVVQWTWVCHRWVGATSPDVVAEAAGRAPHAVARVWQHSRSLG